MKKIVINHNEDELNIEDEIKSIKSGILKLVNNYADLQKQLFIQMIVVYIMLGFIIGGLIAIAMNL